MKVDGGYVEHGKASQLFVPDAVQHERSEVMRR
jgi:hypothetical protein